MSSSQALLPRLLLLCLACLAPFAFACGDDAVCGPEDGSAEFVDSLTTEDEPIRWVDWKSSPNNDCGETGGPVSLTLEATQEGVANRQLVLCLPRPDRLAGKTIDVNDSSRLQIIDVFANLDGAAGESCLASLDRSRPAEGSIAFYGVCDDGTDPAGYSMAIDMLLPVQLLCGEIMNEDELRFSGEVSVRASQP